MAGGDWEGKGEMEEEVAVEERSKVGEVRGRRDDPETERVRTKEGEGAKGRGRGGEGGGRKSAGSSEFRRALRNSGRFARRRVVVFVCFVCFVRSSLRT